MDGNQPSKSLDLVFISFRIRKEHEAEIARVEASLVKQTQIAAKAEQDALRIINETQVRISTYIGPLIYEHYLQNF